MPGKFTVKAVRFAPAKRKVGKGGAGSKKKAAPKKSPKPVTTPVPGGFVITPRRSETGHIKMQIVAEGGVAFEVPYAPRQSTLDGIVPNFAEVERGGREPLLLRSGGNLLTHDFELALGYPDPDVSIESELTALRAIAESGSRVMVALDPSTSKYRWRITKFAQETTARQHGTNDPTRAVVTMTLTEAADPVVAVGPVTGGHSTGGKGGKGGKDDDKKRPKTYTMKKGDTLQSVAKRFYGSASFWDEIAKANKIRNVKKQVKVGLKLTLPKVSGGEGAAVFR